MAKKIPVSFTLNGEKKTVEAYPMARLLDVLREELYLTGTKEGCGEGECGACAVFINDTLVNSCLVPILQIEGEDVITIEGIDQDKILHPVQEAFLKAGGIQCGICTPGMIMAAIYLLKRNKNPTEQEIRMGLGGNLCRCTGYVKIIDSVRAAAELIQGTSYEVRSEK